MTSNQTAPVVKMKNDVQVRKISTALVHFDLSRKKTIFCLPCKECIANQMLYSVQINAQVILYVTMENASQEVGPVME